MGKQVQVKPGYTGVWLYSGGVFDGGDTATLTDDEYNALGIYQNFVTVTGTVDDPDRSGGTDGGGPASLDVVYSNQYASLFNNFPQEKDGTTGYLNVGEPGNGPNSGTTNWPAGQNAYIELITDDEYPGYPSVFRIIRSALVVPSLSIQVTPRGAGIVTPAKIKVTMEHAPGNSVPPPFEYAEVVIPATAEDATSPTVHVDLPPAILNAGWEGSIYVENMPTLFALAYLEVFFRPLLNLPTAS